MVKEIVKVILLVNLLMILTCSVSINSFAEEKGELDEISDDEWLEIPFGGRGIKVLNEYGTEIVVIDKFGGIYLNGDIYINYEKYKNNIDDGSDQNGFNFIVVYGMLALLFVLYGVSFFRDKKSRGLEQERGTVR